MMANIRYALQCSVLGEEFRFQLHSFLAIEEAKVKSMVSWIKQGKKKISRKMF